MTTTSGATGGVPADSAVAGEQVAGEVPSDASVTPASAGPGVRQVAVAVLPPVRVTGAVVRYVLTVYAGVGAGLAVLGLLATALLPRNTVADVPGWPAPPQVNGWSNVVTAWERWDALWFLRIASEGYRLDDSSAAFFPLYPMLVRVVGTVTGDRWLLAGYVVSNLALIGALVVVYVLTAAELGDRTARLTVLLLCIFPTGFFFFAPYSESLFLLLSAGALLAARRGLWPTAALLGVGASACRSVGLLLVLPLAVEAVQQALQDTDRRTALRWLPLRLGLVALVPLGFAAYLWSWRDRAGDALRPFSAQGGFGREPRMPWQTLLDGLRVGEQYLGGYPGGYHTTDAVLVLVAIGLAVWVALRTRLLYGAYVWAGIVFPLLLPFGGRPFMSMPRFILVLFPLFWGLAVLAQRYRATEAVVAVSAAGMGVLGLLFVNWYFVF